MGCVNEGAIDAQATRTAGVVATMNKYTKLENCANNAAVTCSDVTASNSRVAGIVSAMGGHTYLTSCVNNGTVAFAVAGDTTHGYAAGIAGQTNDNNTAIDGCENYGAVLSDIINAAANKYIGIVCANTNKKTIAIRNCKVGGRIGPFSDGQQGATEITEQNFEQYIYFTLTGGGVPTLENNSFSGGPAKPGIATVEDLTAFRDAVNAGESTAQWEDAGGVVSLLGDIDMKDVAGWTPIGNASYKWEKNLLTIEGNAFKGTFDGQGYALKNLKLAYGGSAANTAYGLFGVLDGATVRNLTVGAALGDASALKVTASGGTAEVGVIAGVCRDANVSDCVNYAKIEYDGTSAARVSAAWWASSSAKRRARSSNACRITARWRPIPTAIRPTEPARRSTWRASAALRRATRPTRSATTSLTATITAISPLTRRALRASSPRRITTRGSTPA